MGYIENNLVPGETVLYKTRLHWIVLVGPLLLSILLAALGIAALVGGYRVGDESRTGLVVGGTLLLDCGSDRAGHRARSKKRHRSRGLEQAGVDQEGIRRAKEH